VSALAAGAAPSVNAAAITVMVVAAASRRLLVPDAKKAPKRFLTLISVPSVVADELGNGKGRRHGGA
jgi:hypothetical protein